MRRTASLIYGVTCYGIFLATFLYFLGFLIGAGVPRSIDTGASAPIGTGLALAINAGLVALFGLQHSVMARPGFKRVWTRVVPPEIERSTYVLLSSAVLALLCWQWQPVPAPVWSAPEPLRTVLLALFPMGVATVLYATFLIDHFDLFGLRQVVMYYRGVEPRQKSFVMPGLYRHVRHPLYLGWLITLWATPVMSVGHLWLAALSTGYIFVAIVFEERDLASALGSEYRRYQTTTPMLLPLGLRAPARPRRAVKHPA
jgi:protein-S-isoprenylcysteine O-methyltransferase Ste14